MKYEREGCLGFTRGIYSRATHRARTEIVWFELEGGPLKRDRTSIAPAPNRNQHVTEGFWRRRDSVVEEQCYTVEEIGEALRSAGFSRIDRFSALEAGVSHNIGYGRIFVRALA
jgi:hypothetical protein